MAPTAARASKNDPLIYGLLIEQGDWRSFSAWEGKVKLDAFWNFQSSTARAMGTYYGADGDEGELTKVDRLAEEVRTLAHKSGGESMAGRLLPGGASDGRYSDALCFLNLPEEAVESLGESGPLVERGGTVGGAGKLSGGDGTGGAGEAGARERLVVGC